MTDATTAPRCSQHPEAAATHQCEMCLAYLCGECVDEGHALLFCSVCGDRARPLNEETTPSSPKERVRQQALDAPYSLWQAMGYSLRGSGGAIWGTGVACLALLDLLLSLPGVGCIFGIPASLVLGLLIISLQFKIARSTAQGDVDAPDWPELGEFGERILDFLTSLCLGFLYFLVPIFGSFMLIGVQAFLNPKPNLLLYLLVAAVLWLSVALYYIAFGACATYGRLQFINLPGHLIALFRARGDGFTITNLIYVLIVLQMVVAILLATLMPTLVANILTDFITMYWSITSAHLAGILFRRHRKAMDSIYR